jgi:hypothetical protein
MKMQETLPKFSISLKKKLGCGNMCMLVSRQRQFQFFVVDKNWSIGKLIIIIIFHEDIGHTTVQQMTHFTPPLPQKKSEEGTITVKIIMLQFFTNECLTAVFHNKENILVLMFKKSFKN